MLTDDERRTLHVLEAVGDCEPPSCDNWTRIQLQRRGLVLVLANGWLLTDAGRRELDRLREKEREGV